MGERGSSRVALIEAGSPGLNIYSHVAMGRGVPLLATVARNSGYDARAFVEDVSGKDSIDWEWVAGADVVGFSLITCTVPRTIELVARTRATAPSAKIVFGGPEPTCHPQRSLELGADLVVRGEAEFTLPRLLDSLTGRSDEALSQIQGTVWLDETGKRCEGPPPKQLDRHELDGLPLVDRSVVHHSERASVAAVWRSRGCPSRCDFCEVCEIWPRYVSRSSERTVTELMDAEEAGYSTAFLIDDNAAANKQAFKEFLRQVASRGYLGMLVAQLRADSAFTPEGRLDKELLKLLKRVAAVTIVCVGIESADDTNLEAMHKRVSSGRMAKAMKAMRRYGLLVHGMFIALDSDTREIIRRNGTYARRYVTSLQYLFETPLPGTKRTAEHERRGALLFSDPHDLSLYDGMHVVLRPQRMSPIDMQRRVTHEYQKFYSRGRIVIAAIAGAFGRYRLMSPAQKAAIARLRGRARVRRWAWFHIQYKFAPVSFLAVGRQRVNAILVDDEYHRFEERLRSM